MSLVTRMGVNYVSSCFDVQYGSNVDNKVI